MLEEYGYIGLFFIAAFIVAAGMVIAPAILRLIGLVPKNPNAVKNSPFECGMETIGKTQVMYNFRYYFYALMFVVLDVLVLFLYPWAVRLRQLGWTGFIAIAIPVFLVVIAYIYAWRKKVLEWK